MSYRLSQEEMDFLTGQPEFSELDPLKRVLSNCLELASKNLSSITNISPVSYGDVDFKLIKCKDFEIKDRNSVFRITLDDGLSGFVYLNFKNSDCSYIASSMMGSDDIMLSSELVENALSEATNQLVGGLCTTLAQSLNSTIKISTPDYFDKNLSDTNILFNEKYNHDTNLCVMSSGFYLNKININIIFVFASSVAQKASFDIKAIESEKLLELHPETTRILYKFFSCLGNNYKDIFSMMQSKTEVSIVNLNPIYSVQYLGKDIINNYTIINTNSKKDIYNSYIFEKKLVSDIKKFFGLMDDEGNTWELLKELNNQFLNIFYDFCDNASYSFDAIECSSFLEIPNNQYLLVSFLVGDYKFYQLLNFNLINNFEISMEKINNVGNYSKIIDNLENESYNSIKHKDCLNMKSMKSMNNNNNLSNTIKEMPFEVSAILGEKIYTIKELLHFSPGYIVHFDRRVIDDIDICINNVKKAEGEVGQLTYNKLNNYAIKIKKIIKE